MSNIVFQLPDSGFNPNKVTGESLAATTQYLYTTKLNALAAAGYTTVPLIWKNTLKVIKLIKELTGDGDSVSDKMRRRQYLSAIFAVSPAAKTKTNNAFYRYWQKCMPDKNDATGEAWKKKKELS